MFTKHNWLSHNLRALRKNEGLSQSDVAIGIGVALSYVASIEQSRISNPGVLTVSAYANFFGVSIQDLLYKDLSQRDEVFPAMHHLKNHLNNDECDAIFGAIERIIKKKRMQGEFIDPTFKK